MRIAGNAQPSQQADAQGRRLAEAMAGAKADGEDRARIRFHLDQLAPNTRWKIVSTCLKW
jgi:hypothetical protein